jgi:hypothetical protein
MSTVMPSAEYLMLCRLTDCYGSLGALLTVGYETISRLLAPWN